MTPLGLVFIALINPLAYASDACVDSMQAIDRMYCEAHPYDADCQNVGLVGCCWNDDETEDPRC